MSKPLLCTYATKWKWLLPPKLQVKKKVLRAALETALFRRQGCLGEGKGPDHGVGNDIGDATV